MTRWSGGLGNWSHWCLSCTPWTQVNHMNQLSQLLLISRHISQEEMGLDTHVTRETLQNLVRDDSATYLKIHLINSQGPLFHLEQNLMRDDSATKIKIHLITSRDPLFHLESMTRFKYYVNRRRCIEQ